MVRFVWRVASCLRQSEVSVADQCRMDMSGARYPPPTSVFNSPRGPAGRVPANRGGGLFASGIDYQGEHRSSEPAGI